MSVRHLRASDADAMARIHAASFDKPWPALDMAVHVARDLCLGAIVGEQDGLVSFAILRRSDVDAEILTVATDPKVRGQGYAAQVLAQAILRLRESALATLFLEVAEDNNAARALYARLGFHPIGRRPGYYIRPEGRFSAITYALDLSSPPLDAATLSR